MLESTKCGCFRFATGMNAYEARYMIRGGSVLVGVLAGSWLVAHSNRLERSSKHAIARSLPTFF